MTSKRQIANDSVIEWLLEDNNHSVRYHALKNLLDLPDAAPEVMESRKRIMTDGIVPKILARQSPEGCWEPPGRFYTSKYKGTVWQLIILAELGADGNDERIRKACEFILKISQDAESGGFAHKTSLKKGGGLHSEVIPCLTGNMVWSLIKLGFSEDPRVRNGIKCIVKYQRFDDVIDAPPEGWPYDRLKMCFGKHTCHMSVVKSLKALSEIHEKSRSGEIRKTIDAGIEYLLAHRIYRRSHDLDKISRPGWLKLGFPMMYQSDILEIILILLKLNCHDKRMADALEIVKAKQGADGKWKLENTFNGRFQVNIEQKDKPSKWITLRSLTALKGFKF